MVWQSRKNLILDEKENIIILLDDGVSSFHKRIILNSPSALDLIGDFVMTYDLKRKISKHLFDRLSHLIERSKDYDFEWDIDNFGNLIDENNIRIGFLPEKDSINSYAIKYAPEMFHTISECLENFERNNSKQKYLYQKFCEIQRKVIERV